mgnify:CR=1 FL=1
MTVDERKALARRSLGMWAADAPLEPDAVFAEDYVNHQEPMAAGGAGGLDRSGWAAVVEANHRAFPDLQVEILAQVAEGDRVATHWRFSATHAGTYEGRMATGRTATWTGVQIDRFAGGRIAESWVSWDKYGQFEQLGLLEGAGPA